MALTALVAGGAATIRHGCLLIWWWRCGRFERGVAEAHIEQIGPKELV
jgi:hypothetical protein